MCRKRRSDHFGLPGAYANDGSFGVRMECEADYVHNKMCRHFFAGEPCKFSLMTAPNWSRALVKVNR